MSGAIGKAAQQGAKAAGKAAEGNPSIKGARKDPELFVCAVAILPSQASIESQAEYWVVI